jgi:SET domain-containing protein
MSKEKSTVSSGLVVKKTRNGRGVFVSKEFKKDGKIFQVKGKIITCYADDDLSEEVRNNTFRFDEERYISPEGELADFLNHSCEPNSKVVKVNNKLFIVAICDIGKQEEVLFDYSTIISSDDVWEMDCNCGSLNCRGVVKKFSSLPKKIKTKYIELGMVPDYIK